MSSRNRQTIKKAQQPPKSTGKENKTKYVLLRDQASEKLIVLPFQAIVSTKNRAKLSAGDVVSHGLCDKRIRATILLIGEYLCLKIESFTHDLFL
jgi:hypothetical protein